jgi:hypothetical protein
VALASAAAIAVATPAIAPNLTPTPTAVSAAEVELANFADLLSITAADWNNYFFVGWGGAIGSINVDPETTESDYWAPQCDYDCLLPGIPGVTYLALDALINGNGAGIQNVNGILNPDYDPDEPIGPDNEEYLVQPWGTSAVNYFYEAGLSTGIQYILQQPFAPGAPLANEQIFNAIKLAFQIGSGNLWITAYVNTLAAIAVLAEPIPVIGPYLYRGIGSYLGPAFVNIDTLYDYDNYAGIPGVLRYIGGVITTGGNPNPYPTLLESDPEPTAAVSAASVATPVVAALKAEAPKADVEAPTAGDSAEADASATESTETPADTTAAVESPSSVVAETAAEAPARTAKRPVRNAVERVTKKIASAVGGATSGAATGGAAQSDGAQSDAAQSGAATGGTAESDGAQSDEAQSGAAESGAATGGAADGGSDSDSDSADSDS